MKVLDAVEVDVEAAVLGAQPVRVLGETVDGDPAHQLGLRGGA